MQPQPSPARHHPRLRRWLIGLAILAVLLCAYAVALRWFVTQVDSRVQDSLHAIPALQQQDETPPEHNASPLGRTALR